MGCHTYRVGSGRDRAYLRFSEGDDATTCLCTFPHNYAHDQALDANTVRSMALLGAAMAMAWHGDLHPNDTGDVVLPASLPAWVVQAIDAALPVGREGDESPLVKGALDAQGDAERQLFAAQARIRELERQNELLKGANDAQDERERLAGAECGVPYELHGCDWPWGVSQKVQAQRARICELEAQLASGPACISLQQHKSTVDTFIRWATTGRFYR
ncbi:hypothetical protein [Luteitalea sp.]